jgi:long-subunit fatty acid transport protein
LRPPLVALAAWAASLLLPSRPAAAGPLDDPHVGGLGFSGPTTGDLAAIYWNPGALGLLQGQQALLSLTGRVLSTRVSRAPIDPASGLPGGSRGFGAARSRTFLHPGAWPPAGAFLGYAASIGNRVTFGAAILTPFSSRVSFPGEGEEQPARYHAVELELQGLSLVPSLALRLGRGVRVGVAPGVLFSSGSLVFDEDAALSDAAVTCDGAPCGAENPSAAIRYAFESGKPPFRAAVSLNVSAGIAVTSGRFTFGLAYLSRPLGGPIELEARRTTVRSFAPGSPPSVCTEPLPASCVFGRLRYRLPDTLIAGVAFRPSAAWDLAASARRLGLGVHDTLALRVSWPADERARPPGGATRVDLHRGFRPAYELRLRAARRLGASWLIAALRGETSAVPKEAVTPAAVDGAKLEPSLALSVPVGSSLLLTVGYALVLVAPVETGPSRFDPTAAVACRTAGGDLADPACLARLDGRARPTAAGRYELFGQTLSAAFTVRL